MFSLEIKDNLPGADFWASQTLPTPQFCWRPAILCPFLVSISQIKVWKWVSKLGAFQATPGLVEFSWYNSSSLSHIIKYYQSQNLKVGRTPISHLVSHFLNPDVSLGFHGEDFMWKVFFILRIFEKVPGPSLHCSIKWSVSWKAAHILPRQ